MDNIKVLIASDSFKGSVSTIEVAEYIEEGIKEYNENIIVDKVPIADGGEGTVDALVLGLNGKYHYFDVTGPLGTDVNAKIGVINNDIAIIEMAEASGMNLLSAEELNPYNTTTYGTGELIRKALDLNCKKIYIGIGGSATNDGGAGMAQALGAKLLDKNKNNIEFGAKGLNDLEIIDLSNFDKRIESTEITILSDVNNFLCGDNGATYIYGIQKGATIDDLKILDNYLFKYGEILEKTFDKKIINIEGAGAAGGLGAGLIAFCDAKLYLGIDTILNLINIEDKISKVDLVITGEGKLDNQTSNGKAPIGVATIAKRYNKPVVAIVGSRDININNIYIAGIDLVIDIINEPMDLKYAIENSNKLIASAANTAIRAFMLNYT